jgi:hypothetical protein
MNVRTSYDTRKWTKIQKGIKRKHDKNMIFDKEGGGCKMQWFWRCVHPSFSYHSSGSLWKERKAALGREPLVCLSSTLSPTLRMELEPCSTRESP